MPETPDRLQAVQNVLATVVDIGAKTDYDNTETRMLKRNERAVMAARREWTSERSFRILEHSINVILIWYENQGV